MEWNNEQKKIIIIGAIVFGIGSLTSIYQRFLEPYSPHYTRIPLTASPTSTQPPTPSQTDAKKEAAPQQKTSQKKDHVTVHIAGAVRYPGLYTIQKNTRSIDAIQVAGGVLPQANIDKINLAAKVKDGKRLFIPFHKSPKARKSAAPPAFNSGKISINTANTSQLRQLPGIGQHTADAIIQHRQKNGPFAQIHDLQKVSGIGKKKYQKLQPHLRL